MEVLKEASHLGVDLYQEHLKYTPNQNLSAYFCNIFRFASSFCSVWKNDENILLILSAIALFTPDRQNVVHANVIKKVQV